MSKQKIAFVVPSLCRGGAQRVVVNLANCMATTYDCDVSIITFYCASHEYEFISDVNRINFDIRPKESVFGKINILFWRVIMLKKTFKKEKFDKIYSFMDSANIVTGLTGFQCYISIRTNVDFVSNLHRWFYFIYKRNNILKLICLTSAMKKQLSDLGMAHTVVIHNPVISIDSTYPVKKCDIDYILSAGRLVVGKNHSLVIHAYNYSVLNNENIKLWIAGEGPERQMLAHLIDELGLQENIKLLGLQNDDQLRRLYTNALFFVMSSNCESWGNVLTESLNYSTSAISTDCPQGPSDIIHHGKNGLLVPVGDQKTMTEAMDALYQDKDLYLKLKKNAKASVAHLAVENIAKQWLILGE